MMSTPASSQRRIWSIVAFGIDGGGIGHRLHGDRAHRPQQAIADHDLARLTAHDVAPGTNGHEKRSDASPHAYSGSARRAKDGSAFSSSGR